VNGKANAAVNLDLAKHPHFERWADPVSGVADMALTPVEGILDRMSSAR
jgi:hypothetical protein